MSSKPVFNLVYYNKEERIDCGAVWDNGKESGTLSALVDIEKLSTDQNIVRIKMFPNNLDDRAKVLIAHLNELLVKSEQILMNDSYSKKPFYFCLVKEAEKWVNVGAVWNNTQNGNLDFQLKLDAIEGAQKTVRIVLAPNKKFVEIMQHDHQVVPTNISQNQTQQQLR